MKTDREISLRALKLTRDLILRNDELEHEWTSPKLYEAFCLLASENEMKNSQILWPVRTALSGREVSPGGATELAEILGRGETMKRIEAGISKLEKELEG